MDLLAGFQTFVRVTETGSFSAVAQERGATQSAISRQVTALEEELGVRLLNRSTRGLSLTQDGSNVLGHARRVLEAVEATREAAGLRRAHPSGHVRLAVPVALGLLLSSRVKTLLARHPDLSLELITGNAPHDIIEEGLDLELRVGDVAQTSLIVRPVGPTVFTAVAAPVYLQDHAAPAHPLDLQRHDCIVCTSYAYDHVWRFSGSQGDVAVPVAGHFRVDNFEGARRAALAGVGVALLPHVLVWDNLRHAELAPLLTGYRTQAIPVSVVYASRRNLPARTRVVIDFLLEVIQEIRSATLSAGDRAPVAVSAELPAGALDELRRSPAKPADALSGS
jgi:DNA-binding transcriptional LysR family regulator